MQIPTNSFCLLHIYVATALAPWFSMSSFGGLPVPFVCFLPVACPRSSIFLEHCCDRSKFHPIFFSHYFRRLCPLVLRGTLETLAICDISSSLRTSLDSGAITAAAEAPSHPWNLLFHAVIRLSSSLSPRLGFPIFVYSTIPIVSATSCRGWLIACCQYFCILACQKYCVKPMLSIRQ